MATADFARYRALVLTDWYSCGTWSAPASAASMLQWVPAVTGPGHNVIVLGMDATSHAGGDIWSHPGQDVANAIKFVTAGTGTGFYFETSVCANDADDQTILNALSGNTSGTTAWPAQGSLCDDAAHVLGENAQLYAFNDVSLSSIGCSIHSTFTFASTAVPSGFSVVAIDTRQGATNGWPDGSHGNAFVLERGVSLTSMPQPATQLNWALTSYGGYARSMVSFNATLSAVDTAGNPGSLASSVIVSFATSDTDRLASVNGGQTLTLATSSATVPVLLRSLGSQTLTATSAGLGSTTSSPISVVPASLSLNVAPAPVSGVTPTSIIAGAPIAIGVTPMDGQATPQPLCGASATVNFDAGESGGFTQPTAPANGAFSTSSQTQCTSSAAKVTFTGAKQTHASPSDSLYAYWRLTTCMYCSYSYGYTYFSVQPAALAGYKLSSSVNQPVAGTTYTGAFTLNGYDTYGNLEPSGTAAPANETVTITPNASMSAGSTSPSPCNLAASPGAALVYPSGGTPTAIGSALAVSTVPATFDAAFCKAGSFTLTAATSVLSTGGGSSYLTVVSGSPVGSIVATPSTVTPSSTGGGSFTVTVSGPSGAPIVDAWGNPTTANLQFASSLIHLPNCTPASSAGFTPNSASVSNGVYTATLTQNWITPAGDTSMAPQLSTYSVTVGGSLTTTFNLSTSPGPASQYAITTSAPNGVPQGSANVVQAWSADANCNPVAGYQPTSLTLSSSDTQYRHGSPSTTPGAYTFTPPAGGYLLSGGSFTTSQEYLFTPGNQTFAVVDNAGFRGTSAPFNVLSVSGAATANPPTIVVSGTTTITAVLTASNGAPVVGHALSIRPNASTSGNDCGTLGTPSNGGSTDSTGTVTVSYTGASTPGFCSITVADQNDLGTVVGSVTITQSNPPYSVSVVVSPVPAISPSPGSTGMIIVTVKNSSGTPVTGDSVTISASSVSPTTGVCSLSVTGVTDGSGQVKTPLAQGTVAGTCKVTATEASTGGSGSTQFNEA